MTSYGLCLRDVEPLCCRDSKGRNQSMYSLRCKEARSLGDLCRIEDTLYVLTKSVGCGCRNRGSDHPIVLTFYTLTYLTCHWFD